MNSPEMRELERLVREHPDSDFIVELQHLVRELRHEIDSLEIELVLARGAMLWGGKAA